MKQDNTHFKFVRVFIAECGRDFIKRGIFLTAEQFAQLSRDRMAAYFAALSGDNPEHQIKNVGRKFLVNVGSNPDDIAHLIDAVGSFATGSIATKSMFDNLQKTIRLLD